MINPIIVALDFQYSDQAKLLIDDLGEHISFYKVGMQLYTEGGMLGIIQHLRQQGKRIFLDLKLGNDIPTTINNFIKIVAENDIEFLTFDGGASHHTINAAIMGRSTGQRPHFLSVPALSSDNVDDVNAYLAKAKLARNAGCDGFIASGEMISHLRQQFPCAMIVAPGIRLDANNNDHKRTTTMAEAIRLGANYVVIGRPVRDAIHKDARLDLIKRLMDQL